jgi:CDP-diacylglycerol---glycerol-3-phosphate 3-phosphatidyltransferase
MSVARPSFGPSALATPANALTAVRIVASPVFVGLVIVIGPDSWLLWALWTVLAFSDVADGHLARRMGTTRSGAFLDPLADKILVLGALGALAGKGYISIAPIVLIALREFAMSWYRVYASRRAVSVPARPAAKFKTLVQDLAVAGAFFPPLAGPYPQVCRITLWVAVALTLYTFAEYLYDGRRLLRARPAVVTAETNDLRTPAA